MSRITRMITLSGLPLLLVFALSPDVLHGRSAAAAPSLPAPSGTIVNVSSESQLQTAVRTLSSNSTIVLAPGTYTLSSTLSISGTLRNIAIRGGTDNAGDVVLVGRGMANAKFGKVPNGLSIGGGVDGVLIANLTIRDVYRQAIVFNPGLRNPHVYNVHLLDAGEAFIRSTADSRNGGASNGVVEYSVIEYSTAARDANAAGIDIHTGTNWIVRHNLFRNIAVAAGEATGAGVLARDYTTGTIADGNSFLNCARAIAFGFEDKASGSDHAGGQISNNFIFRASGRRGDAAISVVDSPATKVVNNTVFLSGTYSTPIEYRFGGSTAVVLANNLLDGFLWARDGATGTEQNNLVGATTDLFVDAVGGDLHLVGSATAAIDHGVELAEVSTDWDGDTRSSMPDIGADEYQSGSTADVSAAAATSLTVAMTAPANGATVSGTTATVTASASGTGLVGVQFKLDGVNLNEEETESPYSILWDTTKTSNGTHTLTAVARNTAGATKTAASLTVTVSNVTSDTQAPVVTMSAPAAGATISGTAVTVSATATDNNAVVGVQFKLDGANLGAEDTSSPFSTIWNTTGVANGSHTLTAVARDAAGNKTTAASRSVVVNNLDTVSPTVSVTAPANGGTVSGATVAITATAADNIGVAGVQFKVDGINVGAEDVSSPYSAVWNTTTTANGTHTLTAVARDASGNSTTSSALTVTVSNAVASGCPCSIWPASATPVVIKAADASAVELGVRFRADTNGVVTGIRFYKGSANTGTHVGNLWSNTGTRLASATFVNETASGWQQVIFSSPVAVSANTTYVASYHTDVGNYSRTDSFFLTTGVIASPLEAPADGVAGANGVYVYGTSAFPTQTYQATNYWVDVVFSPSGGTGDTTAPTVSVTSPAGGSTVSGAAVAVAATASDNVGVVGVQFKVDGANVGAEDTTPPYSISWDASGTTSGTHTLTAVARDAAGNSTTSTAITITVNNTDTTAPTVSVTSPVGGATVSGAGVTVSASATDSVGVVGVQFKLDGANLGTEDTSSPYSISWNTAGTTNGTHTLTAVARDAAGNSKTSTAITVTVNNADTTAPTVSIVSPASAATVSGTAVTISGTATDNVGVVGVQFKVDGVNVGAEDVSSPYSAVWNTTTFADGTHTVTAVARDAAGNSKVSASISVTVSNGVATPTTVIFQKSADHDSTLLTGYKLEVFANGANPDTATAIASANLGKPTPQTNGDISVDATSTFNALASGTYVVTVATVGSNVARSTPVTVVK